MGFSPIVISGVIPNPKGGDTQQQGGEFVLLENLSQTAIDLSGWRILDTKNTTLVLPYGTVIAPGGRLRVHTGRGLQGPDRVFCKRRRAVWNNVGDTAKLYDPFGQLLQTFSYGKP
jgi:hypothetical protein